MTDQIGDSQTFFVSRSDGQNAKASVAMTAQTIRECMEALQFPSYDTLAETRADYISTFKDPIYEYEVTVKLVSVTNEPSS